MAKVDDVILETYHIMVETIKKDSLFIETLHSENVLLRKELARCVELLKGVLPLLYKDENIKLVAQSIKSAQQTLAVDASQAQSQSDDGSGSRH